VPTTRTVTVKGGGAGDYTSLASAEAGEQADLVSLDRLLVIECYASAAGDSSQVTINGWTTDSTRYIRIVSPAGERHAGAWDGAKYHLTLSTTGSPGGCITVREDYTRIEYLQVRNTNGSPGVFDLCIYNEAGGLRIDGCILRGGYYGTSLEAHAILNHARNTVMYGAAQAGLRIVAASGNPTEADNCTCIGAVYGVEPSSIVTYAILKNVYAHGGTKGIFGQGQDGGFVTKVNCMTSDTTATNNGGGGGATNCTNSVAHSTANFTNVTSGSEDYRLPSGSALIDAGVDLSGTFTNDVDGTVRPQNSIFDVGADEYQAGASGQPTWKRFGGIPFAAANANRFQGGGMW
jgi:hypothetical protein